MQTHWPEELEGKEVTCIYPYNANYEVFRVIARTGERSGVYRDYRIIEGQPVGFGQSFAITQTQTNFEGDKCLDIPVYYKPELNVYLPILAGAIFWFMCKMIFRLFRGRL